VPLEELPPRLASLYCENFEACYGGLLTELIAGGPLGCEASFEATLTNQTVPAYRAAIEAGTLVYDGTRLDECEAALRELGCELTVARFQDFCEGALGGTLGAGEACSFDEECEGDAFCDYAGAACPGTCQARGASGASCTSDAGCVSGLQCNGGSCRAPGGAGASCEGATNVRCGPETICLGADGATMRPGTCRTIEEAFSAALGDTCDPSRQLCVEGAACALTRIAGMSPVFECVAPSAAGAACRFAIPDACPSGQFCSELDPSALDFDGVCAPAPDAGEACGGIFGRCALGSRCVEGRCVAVSENGEPCAAPAECFSGFCEAGTCAEPRLCGG
jgi:hypothetical protein